MQYFVVLRLNVCVSFGQIKNKFQENSNLAKVVWAVNGGAGNKSMFVNLLLFFPKLTSLCEVAERRCQLLSRSRYM